MLYSKRHFHYDFFLNEILFLWFGIELNLKQYKETFRTIKCANLNLIFDFFAIILEYIYYIKKITRYYIKEK